MVSGSTAPSTAATKPTTPPRGLSSTARSTSTTAPAVRRGRAPSPPGCAMPSSSTPPSGSPAPGPHPRRAPRAPPRTRLPLRRPPVAGAAPAESRPRSPCPAFSAAFPEGAPSFRPTRSRISTPAQTVKVLPRHLAGPGPASPRAAWPFPFDEDWTPHQSEEGAAFAISPCTLLWTSLVPEPNDPRKGKWITAANRPSGQEAWQITFDATTPVELLHDIHADLLDLYLGDRHSDQDRLYGDGTAPYEAYALLFGCGWSHDVRTDGTLIFLAPEGLGAAPVRHHRIRRTDLEGPGRIPERATVAGAFLVRDAHHTRRGLHRLADLHRAGAPHHKGSPLPHPPPHQHRDSDRQPAARLLTRRPASCAPRPDPMTSPPPDQGAHPLVHAHIVRGALRLNCPRRSSRTRRRQCRHHQEGPGRRPPRRSLVPPPGHHRPGGRTREDRRPEEADLPRPRPGRVPAQGNLQR